MSTFLDQLAAEMLKKDGNDLSDLCIVLPNRRAGIFLRDALSRASERTIWAPSIMSIEDFVFTLSGSVKMEQVSLLFKLYDVYSDTVSDSQGFEEFANWGPMFLSDINEVDMNLIDAEDIYAQLYSVERIARWNPSGKPITDYQNRHLAFVKQLYPLYRNLRHQLEENDLAYQGLAFRKVAENILTCISKCPWNEVWFAGFNALTVAEEHIIRAFREQQGSRVFWDMDPFYVDDDLHEAGFYFRRFASGKSHLKLAEVEHWKQPHFNSSEKQIYTIAAQRGLTQAQAAASILAERVKNDGVDSLSKVAVVLIDEKLLFPLLNALPEAITKVNVTMGYGLGYSQTVSFIDKLFQLHVNAAKHDGRFYNMDVLEVVTHSVYRSVARTTVASAKTSLIRLKKTYLSLQDIDELGFDARLLGGTQGSVDDFLRLLLELCIGLRQNWNETLFKVELGFVVLVERVIRRIQDLQEEHRHIESLRTLQVFWRQLIKGQQLDFVGEPIGGLQIMGMLETRNLDFEEVVMLSVNEGCLPSGSHGGSYFTFDVRRAFGLACQNERDAVTAYHFYRLLQRAQKVHLIYDTDTDSFGGGEVSRYVQQLRLEAPSNIRFQELRMSQTIPKAELGRPIRIQKDKNVMERLDELAEKGFSPSALNTFRTCPFKFYMRYVAGFKEQDEIVEDIDNAMFGTAVHDCLEHLYKPFLGEHLQRQHLTEMLHQLDSVLFEKFCEHLPHDSIRQGTNLLAYEVAKMYAERVIRADLQHVSDGQPNTVLQLEETLNGVFEIALDGLSKFVRLKGIADRIDRTANGITRLIDYKTGSATKKRFNISSKDQFGCSDSDYAFQLLLYHYMYTQMTGDPHPVPSIFFLRLKDVECVISVSENKTGLKGDDLVAYTTSLLHELFGELMNKEVPFVQTDDQLRCTYCDFQQLCQR